MTLLEQLAAAGLLDQATGLPLGAGGGLDNLIKDAAVAIALEAPAGGRAAWDVVVNRFFIETEIYYGLYLRAPKNLSRNSVDNLIGVVVASLLTDSFDHENVLERGREFNWTYSVAYPDTAFRWWKPQTWKARQDWYGRFLGFPPFVKLACGAEVSEAELLLFSEGVAATCSTPHGDTSDKLLLWLEFQVIPRDNYIVRKSYEYFQQKMGEQYGTLDKLMEIYYKPVNGKEHPFTQASRGRSF